MFTPCVSQVSVIFLPSQLMVGAANNFESFVIENSDKKIAETVKASTKSQDQSIVEINSLQSITSKDIENGVTYLGTMEKNLEALSEGLK